jgi:16S rRNA (adenine1518-N6/adenine1519-N6)-dimethyltransferase
MKLAPKRRYSQNFLTDQKIALKIVASLSIDEHDVVVEIGPGKGALTRWLCASETYKVLAVDVDERSLAFVAHQDWFDTDRIKLINNDILSLSMTDIALQFPGKRIKVIGNIPYSITSSILFWLFDQRRSITSAVIMMQREVARRCAGKPGSKDYGILSVAAWFAARTEVLFHVNAGSFFPKPEVTSSVVRFTMRTSDPGWASFDDFMNFTRAAFGQRRKVMSNTLNSWLQQHGITDEILSGEVNGISLKMARTEQLTPEQILSLYQTLIGASMGRGRQPDKG